MATHALTTLASTLHRPHLRERVAAARAALDRLARKAPKPSDPHVALRADLITAHARMLALRPVFLTRDVEDADYQAGLPVEAECMALVRYVLALPAPKTVEGLAVVGLAAAIFAEGDGADANGDRAAELTAVIRAIASVVDIGLPASFRGFGDEPDFEAREAALLDGFALPA